MKTGINYGDPIAGIHSAGYIMTALMHRRRTGRGSFVDLSQREGLSALIGEEFVRDFLLAVSGGGRSPADAVDALRIVELGVTEARELHAAFVQSE